MAAKTISELAAADPLAGTELIEVSQLSATVTITATTLSAAASDNSYNDSGGGFVAAGFAVGDRVKVAGFTGDVANNILSGVITALTTGKMTIGGADGDVIVDDAAGESVTITKWVSVRATSDDLAQLVIGAAAATVVTVSATDTDLLASQAGQYIRFTASTAKTYTVRPDATEALTDNGEWHLRNVGTGDLTIVEGSGVSIAPPNGGTLVVPQGGTVTLKRAAEDTFDLLGQTVAA